MAFLPARATVLPVALVDECAFSLAAQRTKLAPLSRTTAVVIVVGLAFAAAAVAVVVALLPTLPTVVTVVLQVGAPSVAALTLLGAGLLGPAFRLVHWGLMGAHLPALAAPADGVLGAALATPAAVLAVVAQIHTLLVAAPGLVEPPAALVGGQA